MNPPHTSHFGCAWERQIGTIRCVLDAIFAEPGSHQLTHELLVTLMAEVTAIDNARPISALPTDADEPQPLSPSMLLTIKTRPLSPPPGNFVPPDVYARRRWRRVQYLADQFWIRWRREYLSKHADQNRERGGIYAQETQFSSEKREHTETTGPSAGSRKPWRATMAE